MSSTHPGSVDAAAVDAAETHTDAVDAATATQPGCPVDRPTEAAERSAADRRMRRLLRLPEDGPRMSLIDAQNAFSKSIAISAARCLLTYVALPLLAPVVSLSGTVGPVLGIVLGLVSMVAIALSVRRFFAADHKWRWGYLFIGGSIFVALVVALVFDVVTLAT